MSEAITLKTNLADNATTMAMKDGRVKSDIVKFDFCGPKVAHNGFKDMLRKNAYDAGELAIITYLQARAYNKPYVLLPAPVSGRSQHQCIGYNSALGHMNPKDIEGKKVGVRTYAQTTGLWVRGILQHQYGVDLNKVTWMTVEDSHLAEYTDPANCQRMAHDASIPQMMLDGELAAAILGLDMPKDPRVKTLIPDPLGDAKAWYERDGIVPINHMFVVHQDISKKRPDVVKEIYRLLKESRALTEGGVPAMFPPLGLEANRKQLQLAIDWSFEQKILPRRLTVDELFDDTTAALV